MRSARSPLLKEGRATVSALTGRRRGWSPRTRHSDPHGRDAFTVKEFLKRVPAGRLRDGDVWFLTCPSGGNHLPDVKAIRRSSPAGASWPSHQPGALADVAARPRLLRAVAPSRIRRACASRDPPVLADGPDEEKIDLILSNLRSRDERRWRSVRAVRGRRGGGAWLGELVERYGADTRRPASRRCTRPPNPRCARPSALPTAWTGEDGSTTRVDDQAAADPGALENAATRRRSTSRGRRRRRAARSHHVLHRVLPVYYAIRRSPGRRCRPTTAATGRSA